MKWVVAAGLCFYLAGCAVVPDYVAPPADVLAMRNAPDIEGWYFEGRLAFADGRESFSAAITWRHERETDQIELIAPLAQGRVVISVLPDSVIIDDGDARKEYRGDVDSVVYEQLNIAVPFSVLKYWLLGLVAPGVAFVDHEQGFFQKGWLVRYPEILSLNSRLLPKKMSADQDKTRIKLVVDRWELL